MREQQELKRKLDQQRVQLQDSVWQQVFASLCLALWSLPELHILWRTLFADVCFIVYACLQLQPPKTSLRQIQAQEETDAMME